VINLSFREPNPKCLSCPILAKPLPTHTVIDYEYEKECDILFVSDFPKMHAGEYVAFREVEFQAINNELVRLDVGDLSVGFETAIKCPVGTPDMVSASARKICKVHLEDTVDHYKPSLVFACGKLATTMFYGKNVADAKSRGKVVDFETPSGHKFKLVAVMHPWQVVSEPKNAYLFAKDIENALDSEIFGRKKKKSIPYDIITCNEDIEKYGKDFLDTEDPVAVDIETTGLNFLKDTIHTVAFSKGVDEIKTIVIPIDHQEFKAGPQTKEDLLKFVGGILSNKKNRKILQNATFDLKFLLRYGVGEVYNVFDTKLMQHFFNEEVPKSLSDLVFYYFPNEV
jgi:uracil-DNA glycosylase